MTETTDRIDPLTGEIIDQKELAEQLLAQAREQVVGLVGPGGLLAGLTTQAQKGHVVDAETLVRARSLIADPEVLQAPRG
jgi:hypothetical protein